MDNKIKDCKTLEELFNLWNDENHNIFCKDGPIDADLWSTLDNNKRILFIAKESNVTKDEVKDNNFWFKNVALGYTSHTMFSRRISIMANAIITTNTQKLIKSTKSQKVLRL